MREEEAATRGEKNDPHLFLHSVSPLVLCVVAEHLTL